MPDAASPGVTAVGGTTAFLAQNGGYFQKSAWGEPIEQWGSGGGVEHRAYPRPTWQSCPGHPTLDDRPRPPGCCCQC